MKLLYFVDNAPAIEVSIRHVHKWSFLSIIGDVGAFITRGSGRGAVIIIRVRWCEMGRWMRKFCFSAMSSFIGKFGLGR